MNHILISSFIIILTSCSHSPKTDNALNSNEEKTEITTDSSHQDIKALEKSNQTQTTALEKVFNQSFDTLNLKPRITNDESIVSNIPAASYDGEYIITKFNNNSCCFDDGEFLSLYYQNKEVQTIQIYPSEDVEWADTTFDSVKIKVDHLINTRNYYAMNLIHKDSSKMIKQKSEIDFSIEFTFNNKEYQSKMFRMDPIKYDDSSCCLGLIENDYECEILPTITNIWIDVRERLILLEYGIIHGADGCDRGPFFKAVNLQLPF